MTCCIIWLYTMGKIKSQFIQNNKPLNLNIQNVFWMLPSARFEVSPVLGSSLGDQANTFWKVGSWFMVLAVLKLGAIDDSMRLFVIFMMWDIVLIVGGFSPRGNVWWLAFRMQTSSHRMGQRAFLSSASWYKFPSHRWILDYIWALSGVPACLAKQNILLAEENCISV